MGKLRIAKTILSDTLLAESEVFGDGQGFFTESYSHEAFKAEGLDYEFIQDNHSLSGLRGLHFQKGEAVKQN